MTSTPERDAIDPEALAAARAESPSDDLVRDVAEMFEALADPTRIRILYALGQTPLCVRDIASLVGVSESAVSHQLRLLRDCRLVRFSRSGNVIRYQTDDHHVAALFREAEYHSDHVRRGIPDHPYPKASARGRHRRPDADARGLAADRMSATRLKGGPGSFTESGSALVPTSVDARDQVDPSDGGDRS